MIYYVLYELLYSHFKEKDWFLIKALNVFQYVTFRTAYASITALLLSLIFGGKLIKALRRWNIGQQIREEGPQGHMAKRGTPTMGGVLIVASVVISTLLWAKLSSVIPFLKATADPTGISYIGPYLYLVLIAVVLLGSSNAVNLTDGLDGLAISVTFIAMTALTAFTYFSSDARWAKYLELTHRPEAAELTVFCGAMAGASLGFLWYNAPPAEVFMGDVGSLAIGGAIGTVAVLTKQEFMLLMVGGVFVIEALSVLLQVSVFKMTKHTTGTGRRLFKMTPLHHHFEMRDWKESKIVFRFLILAILFALLSLSTLKLR